MLLRGVALYDICLSSVKAKCPSVQWQALLVKCPSVQWQPAGLKTHTNKWFLRAGFLGAPPISLRQPPVQRQDRERDRPGRE